MMEILGAGPPGNLPSSIRSILQGLILIGVIYIASSVQSLNVSTAKLQTQTENYQTEIAALQVQYEAIAVLQTDVKGLDIQVSEHDRRIGNLEQIRGHLH